jgi:hypothetical protein
MHGTVGKDAVKAFGSDEERISALDSQALIIVMTENWQPVFQPTLGHPGRSYLSELR